MRVFLGYSGGLKVLPMFKRHGIKLILSYFSINDLKSAYDLKERFKEIIVYKREFQK